MRKSNLEMKSGKTHQTNTFICLTTSLNLKTRSRLKQLRITVEVDDGRTKKKYNVKETAGDEKSDKQ